METRAFLSLADIWELDHRRKLLVRQIVDLVGNLPKSEIRGSEGGRDTLEFRSDLSSGIVLSLSTVRTSRLRGFSVEARWKDSVVFGLSAEFDGTDEPTVCVGRVVRNEYQPGDWESSLDARWSLMYAL